MTFMNMTYMEKITSQERKSERPTEYTGLLLHAVSNGWDDDGAQSYVNWEFDHGDKQRFYVGGLLWFFRETGMNANLLSGYRKKAIKAVADRTNWAKMPNSNQFWKQDIARPQYNVATRGDPLYFQKAAIVIMSCEVAVEDALNEGVSCDEIEIPEDIYKKMSIIPACWNINDFNIEFYSRLIDSNGDVKDRLVESSNQESSTVIENLAKGNTVTYNTALSIKNEIDSSTGFKVGKVRATPGGRKLGRLRASEFEKIDRG